MDAATLQAKIWSGNGKAAQRLGFNFDVYRPSGIAAPISTVNKVATLPAAFTVKGDKAFSKTPGYKDVLWEGLFDGTNVRPGDYLVNAGHGIYFVGAMPDQLPIICVRCFHTLKVVSPPAPTAAVGISGYNGTTEATETVLVSGFPGALVYTQRGRVTEVGLPLDLPSPYYDVLLPGVLNVQFRTGQIIVDELDQRYAIGAAENNELGWRLLAQIAVT